MKILLVSATHKEVEGLLKTHENIKCLKEGFFRGFAGERLIDTQLTGVGSATTAECLTSRLLFSRYDLVLNVGICGTFKKENEVGMVVNIVSETWGDLGAEDQETFLDLFDLGILESGEKPFSGKKMVNPGNVYSHYFSHIPQVKGLTVNKVHGEKESIRKCIEKFNPDVESMEGAAIFSSCISLGINFQCLRSISNFVEPRNRQAWDTETALRNLTTEVNKIIRVIRK
jgi:futalosine hydrolase